MVDKGPSKLVSSLRVGISVLLPEAVIYLVPPSKTIAPSPAFPTEGNDTTTPNPRRGELLVQMGCGGRC